MAIVSIADLFDRVSWFEKKLEAYYARIRDESKDNGVRLLTYYLARHRRHLEQALENFEPDTIVHIRRIKLKYDIDFYPEKEFHLMHTAPNDVKAEELLNAAVGYDLELVDLYKSILDQPLSSEAATLIEGLIRVEEKDIVMIKKMIATHYF